jgi:phosphatidylserine/phosphatidylglycerophosphate/cardiolipin synthase-like enzyme
MDIVASGPMVQKLRKEFFNIYAMYKSDASLKGNQGPYTPESTAYFEVPEEEKAHIALLDTHPELCRDVKLYGLFTGPRIALHTVGNIYTHLIDKAQQHIELAHMYFFPIDLIYDAFLNASNRNVSISLVTNGINEEAALVNSTRGLYGYMNRLNYLPLMAGRVFGFLEFIAAKRADCKACSIYEYDRQYVLYHKKVMVVDHRFCVIGSYNLGKKSENADYEVTVVMDSLAVARQMEAVLTIDKTLSRGISFTQALRWYFNPLYRVIKGVEKTLLDGIVLEVDDSIPSIPELEGDDWEDRSDFNDIFGIKSEIGHRSGLLETHPALRQF